MSEKDEKPSKKKVEAEALGAASFGPTVTVGDRAIPTEEFAAGVQVQSGLSVDDWNALDDADREKRMNGVLSALNDAWRAARGSAGNYVSDPTDPNFVTIRVKQAAAIPHPGSDDEKAKPVPPHILKVGSNRVPRWVADHEMIPDILED